MCRKLDAKYLKLPLGPIPSERPLQPAAWGHTELDLFGPYTCRGEQNPRTNVKIWGVIMEDKNSSAMHLNIVVGYSTDSVLAALRRFASLRGWPAVISSDPGSQLESASGKLATWWDMMGDKLKNFSTKKQFECRISPANSPWRQGTVERGIAIVKRLVKRAVGDTRLTQSELQTVLFEVANICNENPFSVSKPKADGSYTIITANHLLMGRSMASVPDDKDLCEELSYKARYHMINSVTTAFWGLWALVCTPKLVYSKKWSDASYRDLKVGDLVLVSDKAPIKAKYKLAIVDNTKASSDGRVRSVDLKYYAADTAGGKRGKEINITRSIQRLALILGVEEQEEPLCVKEGEQGVELLPAKKVIETITLG